MGHGVWINEIWAMRRDPVAYRLVVGIIVLSLLSLECQSTVSTSTQFADCLKQRWKWVSGSWVTASEPLTHDNEIIAQELAISNMCTAYR